MTMYRDAILWIDRGEAKIFRISASEGEKIVVNSHTSAQRLHHQTGNEGPDHKAVDVEFFGRVASVLDHRGGTLITGPGSAKDEFRVYLDQHRPDLAARVCGIETLDHPGDTRLRALAERFFESRGHPQQIGS